MSGGSKFSIYICPGSLLKEGDCNRIDATFKGEEFSIIVIRYQGKVYSYLNRCVHMPKCLDSEVKNKIFDADKGVLRCSMHGIVYSPETGESLSDICRGEKLTAIRTFEDETGVYVKDKRVKILAP